MVADLDSVLLREREAIGAEMASGVLRATSGSSIGCRFRRTKGMRRGARGSRRR
jgi:hypothetical protein